MSAGEPRSDLQDRINKVASDLGIRWGPGKGKQGRPLPVADNRCSSTRCAGKGEYQMRGGCYNCRSEVLGIFTKGHEAESGVLGIACPVCGCTRMHWDRLA